MSPINNDYWVVNARWCDRTIGIHIVDTLASKIREFDRGIADARTERFDLKQKSHQLAAILLLAAARPPWPSRALHSAPSYESLGETDDSTKGAIIP